MNIELIISCMLYSVIVIYLGNNIFSEKIDIKNKITIPAIIVYMIFIIFNCTVADKFLKTTMMLIALITLFKLVYKKDWMQSINGAVIAYILLFISEFIYGLSMMALSTILSIDLIKIFTNSITVNIIVAILIYLLTIILKKINKGIIKISYEHRDANMILLFILALFGLSMLLNKLDIRTWVLNQDFYINIGLILVILFIIVNLVIQNHKNTKFVKKYSELAEYSTINDEVLEDYRVKTHEYKNQLAIIKSMTDPKNKELNEYIDNLIEKNKNIKYNWINQVKYIKLPGLKGLLNYKIMEFDSLKISYKIVVSKNLAKEYFDNFTIKNKDDLYSIIGVYLDNAKEAALESDKKEVSIDISKIEKEVIIKIANTYNNDKVDYTKLDEYKYSTKGKNRGIGLYLVQKIVNKNKTLFRIEREINDKYFIQTLFIKTK